MQKLNNFYKHKTIQIKNGLKLIIIPVTGVRTATIAVVIRAGSGFETPKDSGTAHLLEHMLFKGTKKRETSYAISYPIDAVGGELNADTQRETATYFVKVPIEHIELGMDVISDMLMHSKISSQDLLKERNVVIEEINMYNDMPESRVSDRLDLLLYGQTGFGLPILGNKRVVGNMRRKCLTDYFQKHYTADDTVVVIAGAVNFTQTERWVRKYFSRIQRTNSHYSTLAIDEQKQLRSIISIMDEPTEQTHLRIGFHSVTFNDKLRFAALVLGAILGGGMSSRLFIRIRETLGCAYYVSARPIYYNNHGHFYISAGVNTRKVKKALGAIIEECTKIVDNQMPHSEFTASKECVKGQLIMTLEDSLFLAALYGKNEIFSLPTKTPEDMMTAIDEVTAKQVREVAQNTFKKKSCNIAFIGPDLASLDYDKILSRL